MALGRWQAAIQDTEGDAIASASIEVRREAPGSPLASIFSDRDGLTPIGNPFTAEADGYAAFHVAGGAYRITATSGGFSRTWRYVGVGLAGERDGFTLFTPRGPWEVGTTYALGDLVEHEGFAFASNSAGNLGHEPQTAGSPPAAALSDEFWTFVNAAQGEDGDPGSSDVSASSATSVAIGTGSKAFTLAETDRGFGVGARLRAASAANPTTHYMEGVVTAYDGASALTISVDAVGGAGSPDDWLIHIAGNQGSIGIGGPGPKGDPGSSDVVATSTTSLSLGTGSKAFTLAAGSRGFAVGARLRATSNANPATHYMEGVVTTYAGGTSLTVTMDRFLGSGTRADWTINLVGDLGAAGVTGPVFSGVNAQTGTSYTLVLADASKIVTMENAAANLLTIPPNASVAFPTDTVINVVRKGAGVTTVEGGTGVTVNGVSTGGAAINNQYQGIALLKVATNTWIMSGDHGTVS